MKTIQELLRDLREDNDLKQSDIADLISTTQQQYSKYETGESELPLRVLAMLAEHYNVSADYIMGRTRCKEGITGQNIIVGGIKRQVRLYPAYYRLIQQAATRCLNTLPCGK